MDSMVAQAEMSFSGIKLKLLSCGYAKFRLRVIIRAEGLL